MMKPVISHGRHGADDGHPPDYWRGILLPVEVDQAVPASSAERGLLAQAIVLRNAVIMRERPSHDEWHLHGYDIKRDGVTIGFRNPHLEPVAHGELHHRPGLPVRLLRQIIDPRHPVLRAVWAMGLNTPHYGIDEFHGLIAATTPAASYLERMAGLLLAMIARDLGRGFDLYRSWGHALNAAYPWLCELGARSQLLSVLDASLLLASSDDRVDGDVVDDLTVVLRHLHGAGVEGSR